MTTVCHHTAVCLTTNAAANARRQCEQTGARLPGSPTPAPSRATPARLRESTDILRAKGLPPYKASPPGCSRRSYPLVPTMCERPEAYRSESGSHVAALSSLRF